MLKELLLSAFALMATSCGAYNPIVPSNALQPIHENACSGSAGKVVERPKKAYSGFTNITNANYTGFYYASVWYHAVTAYDLALNGNGYENWEFDVDGECAVETNGGIFGVSMFYVEQYSYEQYEWTEYALMVMSTGVNDFELIRWRSNYSDGAINQWYAANGYPAFYFLSDYDDMTAGATLDFVDWCVSIGLFDTTGMEEVNNQVRGEVQVPIFWNTVGGSYAEPTNTIAPNYVVQGSQLIVLWTNSENYRYPKSSQLSANTRVIGATLDEVVVTQDKVGLRLDIPSNATSVYVFTDLSELVIFPSQSGDSGSTASNLSNTFTLISYGFSALVGLFSWYVFPGMTLGTIFVLPLVVSLLIVILRLVKK